MRSMVGLILGGGKGTRLFPLTEYRSKPAVPLAGKFRLIDIPVSNCLNSGISRIYLLTQFNSVSLHRHIRDTYKFDRFNGGFVEILAAQQTLEGSKWYQGTADAVRKNLRYLEQPGIKHVLILSGDQLYRMDYREMLKTHQDNKADVTIAALPVDEQAARGFGIMRLEESGRVKGFLEKPQTEEELSMVRTDPKWLDDHGIPSKGRGYLASMGIYLFNRDLLVSLLKNTNYEDFGKEVFPMAMRTHHVQVHPFDGYWEDIGTIKSFYEANLALASPDAPFELMKQDAPIYTKARQLPSSRIEKAQISNSLIADGCTIEEGAVIENSVIGVRCHIEKSVVIKDSILMGNDFYPSDEEVRPADEPPLHIGEGAVIEGAIVDKNCCIGAGSKILRNDIKEDNYDNGQVVVRDGIVVVRKGTVLPPGWKND
ncbi:MAG: glucose-1-phosphate adenylyltransferase [Planctomycetaceae bacterium]